MRESVTNESIIGIEVLVQVLYRCFENYQMKYNV
jgi:hypothetical protein